MKNLILLRKEFNMNQLDLANRLGVTQQTISKYEKGIREPDHSTLIKLSDIFDVSIDYLLGKTNVRDSANNNETVLKEIKNPELKKLLIRADNELTEKENNNKNNEKRT